MLVGLSVGAAVVAVGALVWVLRSRGVGGGSVLDGNGLGDLRVELQGLRSNVEHIAEAQRTLQGDVGRVQTSLATSGAVTTGLKDAADKISAELGKTREGVARLQEAQRARQEMETSTAESIRRLEAVIAGTASKGSAGENIVDLVFSRLPVEWQVRDFRVGNKTVEFGLRLPNGLVLPIDSKWPATGLIEKMVHEEDPQKAAQLKREVHQAVRGKMREVQRYLEPNLTYAFAVAVVPDAVFDVSSEVQAEAYQMKVVLVGHSMFVPYLLLVFQTVLASSHDVDLERLGQALRNAEHHLREISDEVEGRLSRGLAMVANSRDGLRGQVSQVQSLLVQVERLADAHGEVVEGEQQALPPVGEGD